MQKTTISTSIKAVRRRLAGFVLFQITSICFNWIGIDSAERTQIVQIMFHVKQLHN